MNSKILLILAFFGFGLNVAAQPILDSANSSTIPGNTMQYFIADSMAPDLDAVTGMNVTWDYSGLWGYGPTADNIIDSAHLSSNAAFYPNSEIEDNIGSTIYVFRNNHSDSVVSQGYVFDDPTYGTVVITLMDHVRLMEYPFTYLSTFSDSLDGFAYVPISPFPLPYYGSVTIEGDGYGTLLLGSNTYNNVLRVKLLESSVIDPGTGIAPVQRLQYQYYDPTVSNFPLLMHNTISANGIVQSVVYSMDELPAPQSIAENNPYAVKIYPNPAVDEVYIATEKAESVSAIEILDNSGKQVCVPNYSVNANGIALSDLNLSTGMYLIRLMIDDLVSIQTLVIQ